jgi:peptidoglycan/LPS O-acetylase OafA/YrhL
MIAAVVQCMLMKMDKNKIRFYEIDLLRFLAAMAVVLFHYTFRGFSEGGYNPIEYPVISEFSRYGYLGIHLFFIISGFVILLSAMNRSAFKFAISRIVRLYPAFWAGVSISALIVYWYGAPLFEVNLSQYLMNLTMLSGYIGVEHVDGVYWTLLVELRFYALIFLLLLIRKIKQIEYFLGAWLVIAFVHALIPLPKIIAFFIFPEWAPLFISGSLFYLIHLKGLNLYRGILLLLAYLIALHFAVYEIDELNTFYSSTLSPKVVITVLTVFYLCFTLIAANKVSLFRSASLVKIGILTYPLYLIHQNIGFIVFSNLAESVNKYVLLGGLITLMLISAWLIHILVEKHLGGFMKRTLDRITTSKQTIETTNKTVDLTW